MMKLIVYLTQIPLPNAKSLVRDRSLKVLYLDTYKRSQSFRERRERDCDFVWVLPITFSITFMVLFSYLWLLHRINRGELLLIIL